MAPTSSRLSAFCLVSLLAAAASAAAQPPDPQAAPEAPRFNTEVVVTPERGDTPRVLAPASTVIEQATLATLPAIQAAEILSFLPGFGVARGEFHADRPVISTRGFFGGGEAEYVALLVDGIRMADVESGLIDWTVIPISSVRRVEASRGPAASLYGDASIGGVIQILTDRPAGRGRVTASGGSFDSFTADGVYGRRRRSAGFVVSGAARRTDGGFDHDSGRQVVGGASVDGRAGSYLWRWDGAGDTRHHDDPGVLELSRLSDAPYSSDPMFRFDQIDRDGFTTSLSLRRADSVAAPQARVYVATRREDRIRTVPIAPGFGDRRARALSSAAIGGSVEGEHAFSAVGTPIVRVGVDLAREHLDTSYRAVSQAGAIGALNSEADGRRVRAGVFAFSAWTPAPRLRVTGALRWDTVDDGGFGASTGPAQHAWSPRAGVSLQPSERSSTTIFGSVSRAFKAPTLDQRFDPRPFPDFRGGTFTISNPALVPQRASSVEGGISGGDRVRWSALAYRMTVDEEIDFDLRTFSYANIGSARHTGVELETEGRWWAWLRPSAAYALTRVVEAGSDEQLKNVPRHRLAVGASADLPGALGVAAHYTRAWGAFFDDENTIAIDGRSTLDLRARRPVGRSMLFVDVLNATGAVYEEFGFTLRDARGQVVPYGYPGAPRAARAGITFAF
jgi:iron complex outermembrane receptor protein